MADLLFVVITIVFFILCVGYVQLWDRIIGPDPLRRRTPRRAGPMRSASRGRGSSRDVCSR
jgi:hypothetical protein